MSERGISWLPLSVRLDGLAVVGVGAGEVGWSKYASVLHAGAVLTVVAEEACADVREAADDGRLVWWRRAYATGDIEGAVLAIAATADDAVNDRVAADAAAAATLCLRIDGGGTAALMSVVRRGPLAITVSTGGAAPALARRIRSELGERYGPEHGELAALLGDLRADPAVRDELGRLPASQRAARWRAVLDTDILRILRTGHPDLAKEAALACLFSPAD